MGSAGLGDVGAEIAALLSGRFPLNGLGDKIGGSSSSSSVTESESSVPCLLAEFVAL